MSPLAFISPILILVCSGKEKKITTCHNSQPAVETLFHYWRFFLKKREVDLVVGGGGGSILPVSTPEVKANQKACLFSERSEWAFSCSQWILHLTWG